MPRRNIDPELRAVADRIQAVGRRHKVRWTLSRQTAEMAIAAFTDDPLREPHRPGAKARRRKRHKRLL